MRPGYRKWGWTDRRRLGRALVALALGAAVLGTSATPALDRTSDSLLPGIGAQPAHAQAACTRPSMGTENAILTAAENFMIGSPSFEVFGYARIRRVEGDWARVVTVPRTVTDHAVLILHRDRAGEWKVVYGPGTAGYSAEEIPGSPRALYEPCP